MNVLQKFLRYVRIDTPSNPENDSVTPSTACQFDLANVLVKELHAMGVENAEVDERCYVYASIPANCKAKTAIGFIAHLDVVCEVKGDGVKPQIHKNYQGQDIVLPAGNTLSPKEFPALLQYVGQDIVTSDGSTILGADDKAGVAEIMALAQYLCEHPEVKHGKIGIAFTPDEEIGMGASGFNVQKFGCDFAYTVDGGELSEFSYETFNAAAFDITVGGCNIHPGSAKGKMVNAILLANEWISALPADQRPETTEGREGFYFVHGVKGSVETCKITGILRDHDRALFEKRKRFIADLTKRFNERYHGAFTLNLRDQYYNCAEVIKPHYHLVENALAAMRAQGITPQIVPIRGGTDGSGLSFKGLPCPNLCTGGHNAHGAREFISAQSLFTVVEILKEIVSAYAK